jgi:hypothetical protein
MLGTDEVTTPVPRQRPEFRSRLEALPETLFRSFGSRMRMCHESGIGAGQAVLSPAGALRVIAWWLQPRAPGLAEVRSRQLAYAHRRGSDGLMRDYPGIDRIFAALTPRHARNYGLYSERREKIRQFFGAKGHLIC